MAAQDSRIEEESEIEKKKESVEEISRKRMQKRGIRKRGPGKMSDIITDKYKDYDDERFITLHFSPDLLKKAPRWRRAQRVAKYVREFVIKYVKHIEGTIESEGGIKRRMKLRILEHRVWLSPEINEVIWSRGAENPPKKLRLRILAKVEEVIRDAEQRPIGFKAELRVFPAISKLAPSGE
ncbi:MAG: hypothetical protein NDP24_05005 [Crenarchaeota archaeon]|nr:hypothetical protein [Thermoproteota archaeon]